MTTATRNIPTIDLHDFTSGDEAARRRMVETLGEGFREFGFVNVEGHGIDSDLIRTTYRVWKEFFELAEETKKQYAGVEGGARGYTPFGVEHAKDHAQPDLKEFYHVGQMPPEGHPLANVYPSNVWPEEIEELRKPTVRLYKSLEQTAETLLIAVAEHFDLPPDTFASMMSMGNSILRVIHYPPIGDDVPPGAVRAAEHEDINLITLLCEATDSGLEILTREGEWLAVETGPGQIVADVGDMLSRVTNEVLPATTHRVVNPPQGSTGDRYSMPFFVHPYPACDLTVMDHFVSEDQPPKHPPITAGEFLDQRLREIGLKT